MGNWAILKDRLYLTGIEAFYCPSTNSPIDARNCKRVTLESLFPKGVTKDGVFAAWFAGQLRIPSGKLLH